MTTASQGPSEGGSLEILIAEGEIELSGPVFPRETNTLLKAGACLTPSTVQEGRQPIREDRTGFALRLLRSLCVAH
jgi:hypothetical protein